MAVTPTPRTCCESCGSVLLLCQNPACGKPFPRLDYESDARWGARQYCSMQCANKVRQKMIHGEWEAATKPCARPGCTEMAVQRRTESPASFEARKFHDQECASLARRTGAISTREQRVVDKAKAAERAAARKAKKALEAAEPKPLIRKDVPVVHVEPAREAWRPASWRAMDAQKTG